MSTITSTSTTALPEWYNQYAQSLLGRAYSTTSEPFQTYNAPRVAGFTPDQQQAFQMARSGIGSYQPFINEGAATIRQASGQNATTAAQPFLTAGTGTFPQSAQAYMNPFQDAVVNNIGTVAARNLSENLLPQVNRTFTGGGTFGGSRSAEFTNRAVRDTQEAALREQAGLMRQGYTDAAAIFGQDQNRALQAGNVAGNLANSDLYRQVNAGQTIAGLGSTMQALQQGDVAQLAGIGQQQQNLGQTSANLAFQDFERQRDFPWMQTERLAGIGANLRVPTSQSNTAPGPNTTSQNLGAILAGIGALGSGFGVKI
jgi:hypothetical protein